MFVSRTSRGLILSAAAAPQREVRPAHSDTHDPVTGSWVPVNLSVCLSVCLRPSEEMVKMVLSRPCHPEDQFTTSILRHWASKYDDTLGEHIKAQLIKNNNQPRKRQR